MRIKAMPEVSLGHRIPGPVGFFGIDKNDARVGIGLVMLRPHVKIACRRAWPRQSRTLEPGVLIGGVIYHQFGDDTQAALVGGGDEAPYIAEVAIVGVHIFVLGDIVTVIASWRGVERQQ